MPQKDKAIPGILTTQSDPCIIWHNAPVSVMPWRWGGSGWQPWGFWPDISTPSWFWHNDPGEFWHWIKQRLAWTLWNLKDSDIQPWSMWGFWHPTLIYVGTLASNLDLCGDWHPTLIYVGILASNLDLYEESDIQPWSMWGIWHPTLIYVGIWHPT